MTEITTNRSLIEQELKSIYDTRRQLVPAEVVEAAKAESSPLHSLFEWDDKVAGPAYRNMQARDVIRSVTIKITDEKPDAVEDRHVRAWVAAKYVGSDAPGYVPTESVQSAAQRATYLRQLKREMTALRNRFGGIPEFWEMLDQLQAEAPAQVEAPKGTVRP